MSLVKLTDDVFVQESDVSSVEYIKRSQQSPSSYVYGWDEGTIVILKNGRKIFLKGLHPEYIVNLLKNANT